MRTSKSSYVPAAGYARLTALYDPVMSLTMREGRFRARLIAAVMAQGPPSRVLDLGTGTGSLAIALARAAPAARITGLDPDPDALARARRKAPAEARIEWLEGRSEQLPFEDGAFDAVCSSLMFHHLESPAKQCALSECLRVLRPGGSLHIADWGAPQDPLMHVAFAAIRLLDGFSRTQAHAQGKLPAMIAEAGFAEVRVHERLRTVWGSLELLAASKPVI